MSASPTTLEQVKEALERVMTLIIRAAEQSNVTDMSLLSTGEVALRSNTFLQTSLQSWLSEDWDAALTALLGVPPWRENPPRLRALIRVIEIQRRRFRCTWARHHRGEELAIRPLPQNILDPEELGLPAILPQTVNTLSGGLVLICGPTGAGKSWTMASLIQNRSKVRGGKYITLENPIEFEHANTERALFQQRYIGVDVADYATGLEEALIQNPDCIGVQELRDRASAETALSAALTGHLVLATIHAHDAASAPERFASLLDVTIGQKSSAMQTLSLALEMIVAMRLLPGHQGLVPVFDILTLRESPTSMKRVPKLMSMIANAQSTALRNEQLTGRERGMITFEQSIQNRITEGLLLI
ncbi:MAG TPA: ATPase, T2SS/T4P/T4SS family [Opitutaceae bacterium]|nr:ATPase, T2SS/T4P/T4SS family [Opitutaceae bacterium]